MAGSGAVIGCCDLVDALDALGFERATGVPCSTFAGPIEHLTAQRRYDPAVNEGLALSMAAGAALAGVRHVVFVQNSGLGNLVNPLSSLCQPYALPVLVIVSLRGWPDPAGDEPQHAVMGGASVPLLDSLRVWRRLVSESRADLVDAVHAAAQELDQGRPAVILVPYRSIGAHRVTNRAQVDGLRWRSNGDSAELHSTDPGRRLDPVAVAEVISRNCPDDAVIFSTTGFASRYLHAAGDRCRNFYMQGSMGHVASLALGYARSRPDRRVVVIDGDGACLMHLGAMSTIGATAPENFVHLILDNGLYASTGGQATTASTTNLAEVALACGYRTAGVLDGTSVAEQLPLERLASYLTEAHATAGPHALVVRTSQAVGTPPDRAGASLPLPEMTRRIREPA